MVAQHIHISKYILYSFENSQFQLATSLKNVGVATDVALEGRARREIPGPKSMVVIGVSYTQ